MTFVSLFAGMGGGDLGFESAGWHCNQQVEIDSTCNRLLEHYWPHVNRFGDIRDMSVRDAYGGVLYIVSDPCQANSVASGGATQQSVSLWPEALRLIDWIRPLFVVRENPSFVRRNAPSSAEYVANTLEDLGYVVTIVDMQCGEVSGFSRQRAFVCGGFGPAGKCLRNVLAYYRCSTRVWPTCSSPKPLYYALLTRPKRGTGNQNFIYERDGRVRVLSVRERLAAQGFPRDWLDCLGDVRLATGVRLTGNAWPVFAAKWLGERVSEALFAYGTWTKASDRERQEGGF